MTGSRLGHYPILQKLGSGGMGEVYRAHDELLQRDVAIKFLPSPSLSEAGARERLLREARAAAALNHPSICTIHEVGDVDGRAFIAMELVDGMPLDAHLRVRGPLPYADVIAYGSQILGALAHAHARQIVHRDLKSANLMVTTDGRVKILDFGVARRLTETPRDATTMYATVDEPGSLVGTVAYMAPEQLRGEPADARSDIWAFGIVLAEMATGGRPFGGRSSFELSANILAAAPSITASIPVSLRDVIGRCLEKDPSRRYQSATEAQAALEGIAVDRPPATPRSPWRPVLALLAAAAAIAAVVFAVSAGWRRVGPQPLRVQAIAVRPRRG